MKNLVITGLIILLAVSLLASYNSSVAAKRAATATTVATAGQSLLGLVIALLVIVLLVVLGLVALFLTQDRRGHTTGSDALLFALLALLEEERRETMPPSWDAAQFPAMEDEEEALMPFEEWLR